MSTLFQDLRHGLRMLAKNPGFSTVAVLTLGLGIGVNTAMFSVFNGLLLHPSGVVDPERVVAVRAKYDKLNLKNIVVSPTDFADVRDSRQMFSSAAMMDETDFNYTGGDWPQRFLGARVSWQWFEVFGARPILGRTFRPEEDQPNANQEVILAYSTWKRIFGGDPTIVGRAIMLNGHSFKVTGVMGSSFRWPSDAELWVPLGLAPREYGPQNRHNEAFMAVARIRAERSFAQAKAFMDVLTGQAIGRGDTFAKDSGWGMFVMPLTEFAYGDLRTPLLILLGAVGFVLLIACSNIAGLMLARASNRGRELAIRAALGARRWHLTRQTLVESLLLSTCGSLLGLLLAYGGTRALLQWAPEHLVSAVVIHMNTYVLLFTATVAILSGLLFGIIPAWQVSRTNRYELLKEGGWSATAGHRRQSLRAVLVIGELALAEVLLVGAGLFLESLSRLQQVSAGFQPRGVMTAALSLPETQYKEPPRQIAFFRAAIERLAARRGVLAAAWAYPLPFSGSASSSFNIEGRPLAPGDPGPHGDVHFVTSGYFTVLGIPLRAGRYFTDQDRQGTQPVVLIDEFLARQYWPNEDPVGKRLRRGATDHWSTIVGVVGHVKHSDLAGDLGKGAYYFPIYQQPAPFGFLLAKTTGDPAGLTGLIKEAVRSIDANEPVHDLKSMDERIAASLGLRRFAITLLGVFALLALVMSAIGLYGLISFVISQRTQEIGIRMALGARQSQVLRYVIGYGLRLAGVGILVGALAAVLFARAVASQLFEVKPFDPISISLAGIFLLFTAVLAIYGPARRATKVDPLVALQAE